ncbi:MAG: helix-turn-helix domain-containing protein [Deltaproteobacteria bacterium]|nr:helix-turn-helix domain-containing protein [Deltaproteobacteria bacterium]
MKRGYVALHQGPGHAHALRGPGALLRSECLAPRAAVHTIVAITEVELCALHADAFRAFALARPAVTLQLLATELHQRDLDASFRAGPAVARLCRFLLAWLRGGGGAYPLPFTQEMLARLIDLRPETLSRVLKLLRKDGLIDTTGLFVRDASRLAELAAAVPLGAKAVIPRT